MSWETNKDVNFGIDFHLSSHAEILFCIVNSMILRQVLKMCDTMGLLK